MYLCLTEGKEKYAATLEEAICYMFTFRFRGTWYWRDATEEVPGPGHLITTRAVMQNYVIYLSVLAGK